MSSAIQYRNRAVYYASLAMLVLFVGLAGCSDDDNVEPDDEENKRLEARKNVGESARALLTRNAFDKLVVEVQYPAGFSPTQKTMTNMKNFLNRYLHKPDGIEVLQKEVTGLGDSTYTTQEIRDFEEEKRTKYNTDSSIAIYVLFVDGKSSNDSSNQKTLGLAYYNTSTVLFEETIKKLSGGLLKPDRYKLESSVLNHELGHLLGLVDNGSPMQQDHLDEEHGPHCDVQDCLMNFSINTSGVANQVFQDSIPTLDPQCVEDLRANGGK